MPVYSTVNPTICLIFTIASSGNVANAFLKDMTIKNKRVIEEKDPFKRRERLVEMRSTAADPAKARDFLLRTSMFGGLKSASHIAL